MTPEAYAKLLNYIQENNGWKNSYYRENTGEVPFIKYVSAHYDTRDATIYKVIIRDSDRGNKIFKTESGDDFHNLKEYLDGKDSVYTLAE